jgi:predicted 2-oxoglutarate/Fe(II)-dependent dioxygenase YbiX
VEYDIRSYAKVYKGWLDKELCSTLINSLEDNTNWHQHSYYKSTENTSTAVNGKRELDVNWDSSVDGRDTIMERYWYALQRYFMEMNYPWFNDWTGYSSVRFNRYNDNKLMNRHCDHIHSMFDGEIKGVPTLSILSLLNDDFVGGDLLMWDDEKIDMGAGDVIVFPSSFLYPHRVTPVTEGTRYSAVSWAY